MLGMWLLRALVQDHLDVTLRVAPNVAARIVERPGRWLPPGDIEQLVGDLRSVARRAVPGGSLAYGVLAGEAEGLENCVLTLLYDRTTRQPVACNALALLDVALHGRGVTVIHLGLVMIDPEARSRGLSWVLYGFTCLVLFVREQMRPVWLSSVSQVPAVVGMVSETFARVYPSPDRGERMSFDHLVLAREIMEKHRRAFGVGADAAFDEARFVIADAYTGGSDNLKKSFDEAPKHRDERFNRFCATTLDYGRGDDLLQIGCLDMPTAQRFLTRNVPRRSLPAVLATLAVVSLNRLLLPFVYWLSADRAWGILRPRRGSGGD